MFGGWVLEAPLLFYFGFQFVAGNEGVCLVVGIMEAIRLRDGRGSAVGIGVASCGKKTLASPKQFLFALQKAFSQLLFGTCLLELQFSFIVPLPCLLLLPLPTVHIHFIPFKSPIPTNQSTAQLRSSE